MGWADAAAKFTTEKSGQRWLDRTKRSLDVLNEHITPDDPLVEADYDCLLKIRSLLEVRACKGSRCILPAPGASFGWPSRAREKPYAA